MPSLLLLLLSLRKSDVRGLRLPVGFCLGSGGDWMMRGPEASESGKRAPCA